MTVSGAGGFVSQTAMWTDMVIMLSPSFNEYFGLTGIVSKTTVFGTLKLGCLFWDTFLGQKSSTTKQGFYIFYKMNIILQLPGHESTSA